MSNTWAAFGVMAGGDDEISHLACFERALTYFSDHDQRALRKKIDKLGGDQRQHMEVFREPLVGAFMAQQGFNPHYEPKIDGATPDWHFRDGEESEFLAEVVNFHVERKIETQLDAALDKGQIWSGIIPDQSDRLYSSLQNKASKYAKIAAQIRKPYVTFVCEWFNAVLQPDQVKGCLVPSGLLFDQYATLSGVYYVYERPYKSTAEAYWNGTQWEVVPKAPDLRDKEAGYRFEYYANPKATYPTPWLTSGALLYRFPAYSEQPRPPE